ncbi:unnamed protein product [Prorocentrum cordatum]|uniref:Target of rapamycin complex subunit LST8 n=1 Tax=Prorocentrum cordatum TaxID=2364126 RepID=A0ABN9WAD0_9DINO|nr:unnamed protein product [Polarella glacialis]
MATRCSPLRTTARGRRIWSAESGECLRTLEGHRDWVNAATFSPEGQLALTASNDNTAKVWSTESGECLHTLRGHEYWVNSVMFAPDGNRALTASDDRTARIWSTLSGECLRTLKGHDDNGWWG